ncbi:sensor histidine kinase [Saccharibacillus sp. CPCC 101409]|uniref:sensor histidine kinase n=1 Tax=Saccharibacillus sp. CPCC 101409 TaxID=3058041 RepID=UPI0026733D05|nr:sensor histidine kinase [Saccharibacillus sp. CPCC 101409]MDO3413210.1 sensor histidine kinase [Saccharibacillus sp. CPCC 101409]
MKTIGSWFRLPKRFGMFPYIFLLYLIFPILSVQGKPDIVQIAGYALVALFLIVHRQLYWTPVGKGYHALLLVMILIIVALSGLGGLYNLYLGFFTANFIGWIDDGRTFKRFVLLSGAAMGVSILLNLHGLIATDLISLVPIVVILLLIPYGLRSLNRQMELRRQLDAANAQIGELMKRDERMRIARDLHDTLGHTLSLITLKSQLVEKLALKNPERAQTEAREIQETSRAALRQMRELVSEMRSVKIGEELIEAREMLRTAEIALNVEGETELQGVPDLTQNILSLCLKEAVTNIVKHSRANRCTVTVSRSDSEVELRIEDDGIGLEYAEPRASNDAPLRPSDSGLEATGGGNGLKGMRERLALIEGMLRLTPREGGGMRLTVNVPIVVKNQQGGVSG